MAKLKATRIEGEPSSPSEDIAAAEQHVSYSVATGKPRSHASRCRFGFSCLGVAITRGKDVIRKSLLGLLASLTVCASAQAAPAGDPYPRLAGVLIGSPHDYWKPQYQKQIAKTDVSVLNIYPGWGGGGNGASMQQVITNVKAMNPRSKLFLYVIAHNLRDPPFQAWTEMHSRVEKNGWWLDKGKDSSSDLILSTYGKGTYVLNTTVYTARDSSGKNFVQWFADYAAQKFATPTPAAAGLYTDNFTWKPLQDGDWNRDGKVDRKDDPKVQKWFRDGYRQYIETLNKAMPGKYQIVNVADWGNKNAVLTEYEGLVNGGIMESIIGRSWSFESRLGFEGMMDAYRKTMAAFKEPKFGIFTQAGDPKDYQAFRYGFASCLMDDGYYNFNNHDKPYYGVNWFDEFDHELGAATKPPAMKPWSQGVYRRDFEYGIALVNPKGNGKKTVTLETDFVTIKGTQAPSVNTGATVRKVTLNDRDGIILLRKGVKPRTPQSPYDVIVEKTASR
jgi:hypothetical protein